jgi:arylsulfatase A-like enzyme
VINEIDGFDHSRSHHVGVPAIFGMNFQTVSTAEKLPTSNGLTGGYRPGGMVPGPLLARALDYVNAKIGRMAAELRARGLAGSTAIIISAKHGQSPTNPDALARVDDGPIIDAVNKAWTTAHPHAGDLVVSSSDDDGMLLWLSDRSPAATAFVKHFLLSHTAAANNIGGKAITVQASGLKRVLAGAQAARMFGVPAREPRHPDVVGIAQHGVVYTGGTSKIAEHGGDDQQDRHVPILVVVPGLAHGHTVSTPVETIQIAPTILRLLGLNPRALQAVRIEHTQVLPA